MGRVGLFDCEGLSDAVCEAVREVEGVSEGVAEGLGVSVEEAVTDGDWLCERDWLGLWVWVRVKLGVCEGVIDSLGVTDGLCVCVRDWLGLWVWVRDTLGLCVCVRV